MTSLKEMKADIGGTYGNITRIDAVRQVIMMREILGRETEVRRKTDESAAKDEEIHHLQQELERELVNIWYSYYIICDNEKLIPTILRLSELGLKRI